MIDFQPSDEQTLMVTAVSQLASKLKGRIREIEKARALPDDVRVTAFEMGLGGAVAVPESHGGAGLGMVTAVLLEEALAAGDAAVPFALGGPGAAGGALAELATSEQARGFMSQLSNASRCGAVAWSEASPNRERAGFSTTATRDGDDWLVRGEKAFVLNAEDAELFVVFAQVDPDAGWKGFGAFVVARDAEGVRVAPRQTTLGLDAVGASSVSFDAVRVPDSARLVASADFERAVLRFFIKEGLKVAARCVGLSQTAFDIALDYVANRKAFGKPIGHFQSVAFTLADRAMDIDAARGLVWRAAAGWDGAASSGSEASEREALRDSAWAISFALEAAMRAGDDAVQLHGGAGFMRDYPVEKMMRDAKQMQLCFLTAEHADQIAAAVELGAPLDPALVLPTPETQAVFT